jgi:cell wall-associated NlpC family hydrolase
MARPEDLPVDYVLKRRDIIAKARTWVGVKYRHQGRSRRDGVDCAGLLFGVSDEFGHHVEVSLGYSSMPQRAMILDPMNKHCWKPARQDRLIPGDIGVFWGWNRSEPQHFAFIGENGGRLTVIHSYSKYMKVVEQGFNRLWEQKFHCLYVLAGTEETYT